LGFRAVEELEAPKLQVERTESFQLDERLLDERIRVVLTVRVCRVVRCTEAKLTERRGGDGVLGEADDCDLLAFKQPIHAIASLSERYAKLRVSQRVVAVTGAPLEPIPMLRSHAPVESQIEGADRRRPWPGRWFVRWRLSLDRRRSHRQE